MKCCDYNAGMLKEPVDIQRATRTPDAAGGWTVVWATISGSPDRCAPTALSGSERFASERTEAVSKWRVVVRYFPGLLESDRIEMRGRAYNVRFINNIELADRWLVIELDGGRAIE
jgi:head-tail adaptor